MKQKLKPLFDADGVGADRKYTFDYVIETLKCIRKETVKICNVTSSVITTPSNEQSHILNLLEIVI
jgi:ribonucleotide monophosphatase NagD (HAD superfamily)